MAHVVAIDFECAGGVPSKHAFTQLGAVLVLLSDPPKVVARFNEYTNMKREDGTDFEWEERCVEEFWSNNPKRFEETKRKIAESKSTPSQVINDLFIPWLDDVTKRIFDVYVVTDNAAFDAGILKFFSERDTMYLLRTPYAREFVDVSSAYAGSTRRRVTAKMLDTESSKKMALEAIGEDRFPAFGVSQDHDAVNDAENIALRWAFVQSKLR